MGDLVVRAYNVGFGDAVLVSIPERDGAGETVRHILLDVGNLLAGEGNDDAVFEPVVKDIAAITGGTVDLYVMSHEHLDHVQGLLAAHRAGTSLKAGHAWLTGSAHPEYYDTHEDAKKKRSIDALRLTDTARQLSAVSDPWLEMMVRNNSALLPAGALGLKTSDYVDHLRTVAPAASTHYVDNTTSLDGKHPFTEATLRVLAPLEDTSGYYGRRRRTPSLTSAEGEVAAEEGDGTISPPIGVDAGAFFDLVRSRSHRTRRSILEIDQAANNTSIVLEVEWRGWRLLFPGDAEERSWLTMRDANLLRPVHFVKVSHHGSVNGTEADVVDAVLPSDPPDDRPRRALVSTHDGDWDSVPDDDTLGIYQERCDELLDTRTVARGAAVEVTFAG